MASSEEFIENLDENFNEDEFKELDEALGSMIKEGKADYQMYLSGEEYKNFEIEFGKKYGVEPTLKLWKEYQNKKTILEKTLAPFIKLCENHEIDFSKTCVFKGLVWRTLLRNYWEIEEANFETNIKKYLERTNEKYLIVNARLATQIIDATRVKRYNFHEKIENIIKEIAQEYDLSKYDDIIANRVSLSKDDFYDFIKEVNNAKIKEGLIPYHICKYLICEMLKNDSVITVERDFWRNLRESVFCDLLSHIEAKDYNEYNYFNYITNLKGKSSSLFNEREHSIVINADDIFNFSSDYVQTIIEIFECLYLMSYSKERNNNIFSHENYLLVKDELIYSHMKSKEQKKESIVTLKMIKTGACNATTFFNGLGIDVSQLKKNPNKDISLIKTKAMRCSIFDKVLAWELLTQNRNKDLETILQEMDDKDRKEVFKDDPVLKYEFNEVGMIKSVAEVLKTMESIYTDKTEKEENIEGLLRYSILDISYFGDEADYINNIINYQYQNVQFKKLCIKICKENLEEGIRLVEFLVDEARKEEVDKNLKQQLDVIAQIKE